MRSYTPRRRSVPPARAVLSFAKMAKLDRFTKDAAQKTGKAERTVQRGIARAARIPKLVDVVGTSLDQADQLDKLAQLPPHEQDELIARAKAGDNKVNAKHAVIQLRRKTKEEELGGKIAALRDREIRGHRR